LVFVSNKTLGNKSGWMFNDAAIQEAIQIGIVGVYFLCWIGEKIGTNKICDGFKK
jgi:hypothetical protein